LFHFKIPLTRRGILRLQNDATALAEVRNLVKQVQDTLNERDENLKTLVNKAIADVASNGAISTELKTELTKQVTVSTDLQGRLQGLEQAVAALKIEPNRSKRQSLGELVVSDPSVVEYMKRGASTKGRVTVDFKNAITELGSGEGAAGDIIIPQRLTTWIAPPNRTLRVRQLLSAGQTTSNAIEFVQETGFTNSAAPVAEGAQKPESSLEFTVQTAPIRTIAHWIQASVQVLEDIPQLQSYIDTRLRYGLELVEEEQILAGDGSGQNLLGLIPQATPFDHSRRKAGDTRIDIVRRAMTQLRLAEYQADAIVMHPEDWEDIELLKDTTKAYIWANPRGLLTPTLWGLPVLDSTSIAPGEFLVGAFRLAAQLWDRKTVQVDISTEDRDNFIKNMVTIRAEQRTGLTVYRPESFIFGDFDSLASG
jgi:HK97 family phage major capsid protein